MRFSSLVDRIRGRNIWAWNTHYQAAAAAREGADVILLSVGDPDFNTPEPIVEAAIGALRAGDTHYTPLAGYPELRRAVAREHERISGQPVRMDNVAFTAGAQNALAAVALALLEPGDEVVVPEPMYPTYEAVIKLAGATLVPSPQSAASGFRLDPRALAASITPKTRAVFFATPNNPTGVVLRRKELAFIADLAIKHDLWVLADEVYATLTFDEPHVSIGALPNMAERTVTIGGVSKSHAMAGWRAGWVVGPAQLIEHLMNIEQCTLFGTPGFIQAGVRVALERCHGENIQMREIYRRRRDLAVERLSRVEPLRCLVPDAGMFMLVDISGTGLSADAFVRQLFRATGVSVLDASAFGPSAAGYIRICFANSEDRLQEACRRISQFVATLSLIERVA